MEFSILGPLQVRRDCRLVDVGGPKRRVVLAALLLHAGEPMSTDRLIHALWGEEASASAAKALQVHVSRLRAQFGVEACRLVTTAAGYRLDVAPEECDARRFEALCCRARDERDDGHLGAAETTLTTALDLWRGPALADLRYEAFAQPHIAQLEEQRWIAVEERLAVQIELGQHAAVLGELERLGTEAPLRERLVGLRMRALYRTGQHVQALAAYRDLVRRLDDDLGLEPAPALRELEHAILVHDPSLVAFPTRGPGQRLRSGLSAADPSHSIELAVPDPTQAAGATDGPGGFPRQLTSFVGRQRERAEITRLLGRARLVTLTGPGGCGKTRLALEAAGDALAQLPDGAWFVDLASLSDPALVAQAAALAVGLPIPGSRSAKEALVAHLATREALIVLDNCEHLIDACARLAEEVLRAAPGVRVLATSREALRCADEVAWRVPSLAEAERLFCERAAAARPGFDPADDDAGAVEEICRRLDGMPLAIELAAARTAALSLDQIAARLGDSLDMLGAGRRTALTRQQTLRAAIDWSHELLTAEERVLFRRLAVFPGGFTLEAAEEVCAGGAIAGRRVVDLLARLVEKSLVVSEGERFRLLDTVRQYAAERLEAAAERETVALRHLEWCLALAEEHDPLSAGARRSLHVLEREHDNLRAGLGWALRRDPESALRLAMRLWRFWLDRGYFAEGNRWLQTTVAAAPEQTPLRVEALLAGAGLSLRLGDPNGFLRHVSEAVGAYRQLGDDRATAAALYQHATLAQFVHRADAEALFAEALELARRLEDDRLLAAATHASATLPWYRGDNGTARARVLEALDLLDAVPDDDTPFFDGVTLGMCLLNEGPHGRPRMVWEESLFLFHRFARAQAIAYALNNLAWVARANGDLERAQATLDDALARFRRLEDRPGEALTLAHMGNLSRSVGDFEAARARLEAALAIRSDLGDRRAILSTRIGLGLLAMTAGDAPAGRALLSAALGHTEAVDDLPAMAGVQINWAIGEERLGDLEQAARLYDDGCALLSRQRLQRFEAWGRLALHDVCVALGDQQRAQTALQRARALFVDVGDVRGLPYTNAKPALSAVKQPGT